MSAVTILCLPMVVRLCALIGMSCKLAAYIIKAAFE